MITRQQRIELARAVRERGPAQVFAQQLADLQSENARTVQDAVDALIAMSTDPLPATRGELAALALAILGGVK